MRKSLLRAICSIILTGVATIPSTSTAQSGQIGASPTSNDDRDQCVLEGVGPSPIFGAAPGSNTESLATVEAIRGMLSLVGIKINNLSLQNKFNEELNALRDDVWQEIKQGSRVYVLRINLYISESGIPIIPGGALIEPVGTGASPVDALARSFRRSGILHGYTAQSLVSYQNVSQYAVLRASTRKLACNIIPSAGRNQLEADARRERSRLDAVEAWDRSVAGLLESVHRSEVYEDLFKTYSRSVHDARTNEKMASALADIKRSETVFNTTLSAYLAAIRHADQLQEIAAGLQRVATFASIMSTAASLGDLVTSDGGPVRTDGPVPDASQVLLESQAAIKDGVDKTIELRAGWNDLRIKDGAIRGELRRIGVPDPVPLPDTPPISLRLR